QFVFKGQKKLLFICAGSGITPCYSMISDCLSLPDQPDMALYAQFSTRSDTIFAQALDAWKTQFDVRVAYSRDAHHPTRLLGSARLSDQYPDLTERDVYLCGPQGFMDQVIAALTYEGFDLSQLHCERFVPPTTDVSPVGEFDPIGAEIHFEHIDEHVCLTAEDKGRTFMEIAESRGLNLEVGCRRGMCGTCKLTIRSGAATGNVLGQAVYLCSAYPASHRVVLDA
ncbi:MAG TPA: iron-sulfur cluster-binding domain-containing protein, partial [Aquabacterium sp.]|nr:iron-sulfur cluster-binding domain-containing protein [Aquabacterium sp.]